LSIDLDCQGNRVCLGPVEGVATGRLHTFGRVGLTPPEGESSGWDGVEVDSTVGVLRHGLGSGMGRKREGLRVRRNGKAPETQGLPTIPMPARLIPVLDGRGYAAPRASSSWPDPCPAGAQLNGPSPRPSVAPDRSQTNPPSPTHVEAAPDQMCAHASRL